MNVKQRAEHELMHLQFAGLRKGGHTYSSKDFARFVEELSALMGDDGVETSGNDGVSIIFRKKGDTQDTSYTPVTTKRHWEQAVDVSINKALVKPF
jgi:hypothetical protein